MKTSQIICLIIAIALIIFGLVYPVPEKQVWVSSSSFAYDSNWNENRGAEYIGGDAYNYQIEASLKAGYFTGVLAMKSIAFVGGLLLFFFALFSRLQCKNVELQAFYLESISDTLFAKEEREKEAAGQKQETINDDM